MKISTVITYCTLDQRFIDHCIKQAGYFSDEIVVAYAEKLYDGTPENMELIEATIKRNPSVTFQKYDTELCVMAGFKHACVSRWAGYTALKEVPDWVLFVDADEIIDGNRFKDNWWYVFDFCKHEKRGVITLNAYWYFRSARNQAIITEYAGTLVRPYYITPDRVFFKNERQGFLNVRDDDLVCRVNDKDDIPFIHHFSWVRTKEEMMHKVKGWGHKNDRDYPPLVEEEFTRDFNGKCFVQWHENHRFRDVDPFVEVGL